ncbi:MAG: PmoA family protein [Bacteroidota bacterium]|nr:PmoA family protein [Bacteroidota bacterium]
MKKLFFFSTSFLFCLLINTVYAQKQSIVKLKDDKQKHEVLVTINAKVFTTLLYDDTLYKPILYPVYSPGQQIITRGFPLAPRIGEPVDHPHHEGIWFNYENVNGLDFWNNSYAIPESKKGSYGSIKTDKIISLKNGTNAELKMSARWIDHNNSILLKEQTTYLFSANDEERIIDRITTLTAEKDVVFTDAKDGLLGLRVTKELQIPTIETKKFVDDKGNITLVKAMKDSTINGNYLTSEGKEGDSAWATRGNWCLLYGKKNNEMISIVIIDHPKNIGYPTYWHARGYGLFAANPLGQKIFSNGKEDLHFTLKKGSSATFRYRIVIAGAKEKLSDQKIDQLAKDFSKLN